ncbi:TBC1 domain family member 12-like [Scyliorhinus canicula]|uniref:TBC1 domain family member 12-like n=1 Tax=Scyliorhinus canicula TaxID=7830 RepID=UPI0018F77663|nr:TBC1 domain family member 12-like [Scyliorhinus canicula]
MPAKWRIPMEENSASSLSRVTRDKLGTFQDQSTNLRPIHEFEHYTVITDLSVFSSKRMLKCTVVTKNGHRWAYTCYRPDVGYVQGMSFVAAVLILNLEEADAFIAFANLLNKPCQLAFFRVDHSMMLKYFASFEVFFEENLPKLFAHFTNNSLTPDIYLIDWIFTLYSKSLPLDLACRVWDVFCRDGEEFLFRTALGILKLYEDILVKMDFIHRTQFLTKLPEDITSEKLFACITTVQMHSSNKKWTLLKEAIEICNESPYYADLDASSMPESVFTELMNTQICVFILMKPCISK